MYEAILIGFSYQDELYLPGIAVDLYLAYKFCKTAGANVTVITDIKEDEKTEYLTKAIFSDIVDANVVSFISRIKERHEYCYLADREALQEHLNEFLQKRSQRLFIYFTGHGVIQKPHDHALLLPSREVFSFLQLRQQLLHSLPKIAEIIWVNDCCHLSGIDLPYRLAEDGFYETTEGTCRPLQKLLYLSSTSIEEKGFISREGSAFSGVLFKRLYWALDNRRAIYRDLRLLMTEIKDHLAEATETRNQRPAFFCSYPHIFSLPTWCFGKKIYLDEQNIAIAIFSDVKKIKNPISSKWKQSPTGKSTPVKIPEESMICWSDSAEIGNEL